MRAGFSPQKSFDNAADLRMVQNRQAQIALQQLVDAGWSIRGMQGAFADSFEDDTGIETATMFAYNAGENLYSNVGNIVYAEFDEADYALWRQIEPNDANISRVEEDGRTAAQLFTGTTSDEYCRLARDPAGNSSELPAGTIPASYRAEIVFKSEYYAAGTSSRQQVIEIDNGQNYLQAFFAADGVWIRDGENGLNLVPDSALFSPDTWHTAVFVVDGSTPGAETVSVEIDGFDCGSGYDCSKPSATVTYDRVAAQANPQIGVARRLWIDKYTVGDVTQNAALESVSVAADDQPTTAQVVGFVASEYGTIGGNLTIEVSRDGGTTWSAADLAEGVGVVVNGQDYALVYGGADLSAQPAGVSMRYKVKANGVDATVKGVSLMWRA